MNREDIIRMARESGGYPAAATDRALLLFSESHLERFAALVAAAEREACAKVCEELAPEWPDQPGIAQAERTTMLDCANAIRAMGQP
jgi:hypothetical protein